VTAARREALLAWYDCTHRPLPWRNSRDPYEVLVGEVMAQQTQVSRVIPYYQRFLELFPTPKALASAPLRIVLAAWSGLGYNRVLMTVGVVFAERFTPPPPVCERAAQTPPPHQRP